MKTGRQLLAVFVLTVFFLLTAPCAFGAEQTLINQTNILAETYVPADLVKLNAYLSAGADTTMDKEAALALKKMTDALRNDGSGELYATSGYRSYATQMTLYQRKTNYYLGLGYTSDRAKALAATVVAPPGTSEHQSGLAIDVDSLTDYSGLTDDFSKTPEGKWLDSHCGEYGFILRYPENKTDITGIIFEPWHFRYVGLPHSLFIMDNDICLEEYISLLKVNGCLHIEDRDGEDYLVYYMSDNASVDRLFWADIQCSPTAPVGEESIVTAKANAAQLWSFLLTNCPEDCKKAALASVKYARTQDVPTEKLSAADGMELLVDSYLKTTGWDTVCRLTYTYAAAVGKL